MHRQMRRFTSTALVTMLGVAVVSLFLLPLLFMTSTAFKDKAQLTAPGAPLYPAVARHLYLAGSPIPGVRRAAAGGLLRPLALVEPRREDSTFIDPAAPEAGPIEWQGRWRTLNSTGGSSSTRATSGPPGMPSRSRASSSTRRHRRVGTVGAVLSSICRGVRVQPVPVPGT